MVLVQPIVSKDASLYDVMSITSSLIHRYRFLISNSSPRYVLDKIWELQEKCKSIIWFLNLNYGKKTLLSASHKGLIHEFPPQREHLLK